MNRLPLHRSAQSGRTFNRSWTASDFDPIERPARHPWRAADLVIAALAVATLAGIALGWL
jgi:hypothetical protein